MIRRLLFALAALALLAVGLAQSARADFNFTLGSGATAFSFTSTTGGTSLCAAASTHCFASVPINTAGAQLFKTTNPGAIAGTAASGAALAGNPVRVGISDGTNAQDLLAAIALADGVNGNNTAATASWFWNGTTYDRARGDTTNGAWVNVKTSVLPTGAASAANQATEIASLASIDTKVGSAVPAGTAIIGKVGIDQTTPGTTNGVALVGVNGATALAGNGVTGTGSARVTVASDNTPFAIKIDQTTPGTTNGVSPSLTNAVWGTTAAMTGTTSTALIAGTTSKVTYVTALTCVNSHATVGTFVTIQDGSGGTALGTVAAAAVFGGAVLQAGGAPLFPPTTSGNGVFVADVTTGANVICTASGFHS